MVRSHRRDQFRGKREGNHFDNYPCFDVWQNIMYAALIQALEDAQGDSPYYRREARIWLNSSDCLDLCLELACEDSIRDYLIERNLVIPILAYDSPRLEHVIPIIFRPEDLSQLSWPDRI